MNIMLQEKEYEIQKLNLLAFPRNFQPLCELTNADANVQLVTQHCTLVRNKLCMLFVFYFSLDY